MALFSGIAGLASMAGSWTLFGSTSLFSLAKTAVGIGLNMLAARLSGRKASAPAFSVKGQLQRGADLPQSFLIGRCATAGSLTYANTWGQAGNTPNGWLTMVITLSDLPVQSLDGLWVDGKKCTFGPAHADYGLSVAEFNASGTDHLWVKFYDGSQTVADPHLVNTVSSTERPWDADAVGYGTAYAIVTARINQELFQGFPECLFELTGAKLYDPSKDTSVGGDGPQRWALPATWGGDGDHLPAVQLYNLFRGITAEGNWFYGMQATHAAQMPVAHWINQIEKCRAPIASADGQEPTYRAGGEIAVGAAIAEAMEALLTSCGGRISEAGGLYKLFVGGADAPVLSLTDDDILSSEEQTFSPFFGLADTINGVSGKFPDPAQVWQIESAPPLNNSDLEVEDGGRRLMVDVLFDLVPYSEQVQRLMQGGLNEARRARRHTFVLPPRFWTLEPGDVVSFSSERNGYEAKLFRLDGALDQADADLLADMTEVDPADYDFDTNTDYTPVTGGSVISPVIPPQPIAGWFALPSSAPDAQNQNRIPAIAVGWDGAMDDVVAVLVRVRVKSSAAVIFSGRFDDVTAGSGLLTSGLVGGVTYEVQGRYVPGSARETVWSDWIEVTTLDLRLSLNELAPSVSQVIADAQAAADQAAAEAAAAEASANQALTDLGALTFGFTDTLTSAFAARDVAIGAAQGEINDLLIGFAGGTLQGALDAQQTALSAEVGQAQAAGALEGVSVLSEPAANWTHRGPVAEATVVKAPAEVGSFVTDDPDFGLCFEFPNGDNRTIGPAAGFEYQHGHIYEITYRFKTVNDGLSGGGVKALFGLTTQRGTAMLEGNLQTSTAHPAVKVADGVQEVTVQFAATNDTATGADHFIALGALSATANRAYPHIRQWHGASHDGILRVASITVRDITAARAVDASVRATLTQDYYTAAAADSAIALSQQTVQSNLDALSAQLSSDYLTAVQTDSAIAVARQSLSATISNSQGVLKSQYLADALGWNRWASQGVLTVTDNEVFGEGQTWDFDVTDTQMDGLVVETTDGSGAGWVGQKEAEGYVVECDFTLVSGTLTGAGLYIAWYNDVPQAYAAFVPLTDALKAPLVLGERMTAQVLLRRPAAYSGSLSRHVFHAFANWTGFGPLAAKRIKFHRGNIRVATAEELAQEQIIADIGSVAADLATNYLTSVETDTAIASAETALQTEIDAVDARTLDAIPGDFREDGRFYGSEHGGPPSDQNPLTSAFTFHDDPDEGRFARVSDLTIVRNDNMWSRGYVRAVPGRTYRFTVRARYTGAPTGQLRFSMLFVALDETLAWKANLNNSPHTFTDQWADYTIERTWQESDGPFFRLRAYRRSDVTGSGTVDFSRMKVEDVTDLKTVQADLATNYLTTVETDAAIAAAKTEMSAEISSVSDAQSGFQVVLDNLDAGTSGNDVSVALGGATVGQSGHLVVTDEAGQSPNTSGATNGYSIMVPMAQALQFAKRRARIAVMARSASVNGAVRFEVAYSTSDNGNSGVMVSGSLTGSWAWYVFYYDVPTALAGGEDYLGLYGDADRQGRATEFARVVIDIAPEAEDLPEIASMQGQITDIQGLELGALSGTALGTMLTELSVAADGTIAGVSAFGTAMANLLGEAQSSYRIEVVANGNEGEVRVVAGSDGSVVLLDADSIIARGSTSLDRLTVGAGGNRIENSNFMAGVSYFGIWGDYADAATGQTTYKIRAPGSWSGANYPVLEVRQAGTGTGNVSVYFKRSGEGNTTGGAAATPGKWYEAHCRISSHRCGGNFRIVFRGANGEWLHSETTPIPAVASGSSTDPSSWAQYWIKGQAPADTKTVQLLVEKFATSSGTSSYLFFHEPFLAETHADASEPSPYQVGGITKVEGGQIVTQSILAEHLAIARLDAIAAVLGNVSISESLRIAEAAGLIYGRASRADYNEAGFFIGSALKADGTRDFEFAHTHMDEHGRLSGVVHSEDAGFKVFNPKFLVQPPTSNPVVNSVKYTTSGEFPLGTGMKDVTVIAVGAGGAGGYGLEDGYGSTAAAAGSNTAFWIYAGDPSNGGVLVEGPITALGGAGGNNAASAGVGYSGTAGGSTSFGAGGAAGAPQQAGTDAETTSYGAGGGGAGGDSPSTFDSSGGAGDGGQPGEEITTTIDLTAFLGTEIYLKTAIGSRGVASGGNYAGGHGAHGVVAVANPLAGHDEMDGHFLMDQTLEGLANTGREKTHVVMDTAELGPFNENRLFIIKTVTSSNTSNDYRVRTVDATPRRIIVNMPGEIAYDSLLGNTVNQTLDGSFRNPTGTCWVFLEAGAIQSFDGGGRYMTWTDYREIIGVSEDMARRIIDRIT